MNVYYRNDEGVLSDRDSVDLKNYLGFIKESSDFKDFDTLYVDGYTDLNGDSESNVKLSLDRANSVADYISSLDSSLNLKVSNFGEVPKSDSSEAVLSKDRVVKVSSHKNDLEYVLNSNKSEDKVYFLDQSGSSKNIWKVLQDFEYPGDVYSFSKVVGPPKNWNYDIKRDEAFGQTNYFEAKPVLLDEVEKGKEVVTILNHKDNCGGSKDEIIEKAKSKDVSLSYIVFGVSENFEKELKEIAHKTGGNYNSIEDAVEKSAFKK